LRDLVYGQAKINESLQKKLAAIDKSMETIHAKMDGFSMAMKNQLSFNKALETQLAQLAAATPAAELGKIPGQPESTLESVNVINAMWKEPLSRTSLSYAEKLTRPRRGAWGELAATIREDPGTPVISCSISDYEFDHALCDQGNFREARLSINFSYHYVCSAGRFHDKISRRSCGKVNGKSQEYLHIGGLRSP